MRNIRRNLAFAFDYNTLAIPIAAGLLYAAFGFLLLPIFDDAAMVPDLVFVITNAFPFHCVSL
jgi:Cu+-exporting ATPase